MKNDVYSEFQNENNEILKYILEDKFFSKFTKEKENFQKREGLMIELFVTSVCNQKCEYCYLAKHKNQLYPKEIRDQDAILKNEEIFLQYLLDRESYIEELDFFSGEIWGMKFGNQVLDIMLKYLKKGLKINTIMIPSNCSFILNENVTRVIQAYINEFHKYGTSLKFSASVDGKYLEDKTRSYNDTKINEKKNTDEFYEKLFSFCIRNGFGFHPMVSAYGIEHWIKNFDWWNENLKKHSLDVFNFTMFLEVRNDEWTKEKIEEYLKFLNHVFECFYKDYYKNSLENFVKNGVLYIGNSPRNYDVTSLSLSPKTPSCTIGRSMAVRLGDLALVPCHRLAYEQFLYGHFKVENDKIVGVEANNIQLANKMYYTSNYSCHKCDSCVYSSICMKGCFGSQYESTNDPLLPCNTVCDLFKAKSNFLIHKYQQIGVFDYIKKNIKPGTCNYGYAIELLNTIRNIVEGKEYKQWIKTR